MAKIKLTEKPSVRIIKDEVYFLITQPEADNDSLKESIRRTNISTLIAKLRDKGINNGYVTTAAIQAMYSELVKSVDASDNGIEVTYWDGSSKEIEIKSGGLAFDGGVKDSQGYLHLTLNGEDIEGFTPIYIGTSSGPSAAGINLSNVVKPASVRNGEDAVFSFVASATDDTNITVNWYVDGVLRATDSDRASGSTFSFNAKQYLKASDTSSVRAAIVTESNASLTRQWSITSTAFSLAWGATIQPITLFTQNEDVYVVIDVSAQANTDNIVTLTIGNNTFTKRVSGSKQITIEVGKECFATGANTVSATLTSSTDETDTTTPITFIALWAYEAESPIATFASSTLDVSQYDVAQIHYMVYDPNNETASCTIQFGEGTPSVKTPNRTLQTIEYVPEETGQINTVITCGASTDSMVLNVSASQYNIGKITGDNLRYNLDPMGHSNSDADRESFGGMTFSSGFDWTNGGFKTDEDGAPAFVVKKGHRATLPRQLFGDSDGNGKTVDISFSVKNSDLYGAVAMKETNNGESKGLVLKANEGQLFLDNTTAKRFKYCEESRIDLSINVESIQDQRVMTVWLDGIPSQANKYSAGTLVQDENSLVIGSDNCDVWIYAIRVYNTSLSIKEMIQNYISLAPTTAEKIQRCKDNDVYDSNGVITPVSLHNARPELTIVQISADKIPTGKKDVDYVSANISIRDGSNLLEVTKEEGGRFKDQGTSTMAYGRAAYNTDVDISASEKTYQISGTSIPVSYLNIKVDVPSSDCANNPCGADWYNTHQPYLVPARATPGVRDTIEAKPCAVFFTNTSNNTIWAGSQQLGPGDTVLYAMGNLCNSKKNYAVFGQDGTGEHYAKGCIEVSNNDTAAAQFTATSTYNPDADDGKGRWESIVQTEEGPQVKKDFEWRKRPKAEDLDEVVNAWNEAQAWVVSTNGDYEKFKAEVNNYFAIDSLLFHFLYLEFFGGYDNVSKNTFFSYEWDETLQKYVFNICKNYDDDTILGCDNDGVPLSDYGADFGDKDGDRAIFNADNNTIWCNIQDGFYDELKAMYIALRSEGAWDAERLIAKWDNYQSVRPHAAMAEDAWNKYVRPYKTKDVVVAGEIKSYDDSYLPRMQGSKTYQRNEFLTYNAKYMDGKYGYYTKSNSISFRANAAIGTTQNLLVRAYAKTYATIIIDDVATPSRKIETGGTATFPNIPVHSNATIYITPESLITSITPLDEINNSTFTAAGAKKLMNVILGSEESENAAWQAVTPLAIPSKILKNLSIRNIVNFSDSLDLSRNTDLESLDTRGTGAGSIVLPPYSPLKTIALNACSGISANNLKAVTSFSMASGDNLTSVKIENCNSVVGNGIIEYLGQAISAGGDATRYIRMTGINWTLDNAQMLIAIASKWKGYNELGDAINTPYLSGSVHIGTISSHERAVLDEAFPHLTITYDTEIPSYPVVFKNYDGSVLWTEYVDRGEDAVEPVANGDIETPVKPETEAAKFTFTGWSGGSLTSITAPLNLTATFSSTPQQYTVRFFNNGSLIPNTSQTVNYGASVTYGGDIPEKTIEEGQYIYNVFKGWDKSTGFIRTNLDVNAVYQRKELPQAGTSTHGMTAAEFYGLVQSGNTSRLSAKDRTKIRLGFVPDYLNANGSAPIYTDICDKRKLNGSDCIDTGIQPLKDGIDSGWTVVCDVEFLATTSEQTIICCYQEDGSMGFKIKYSGGVTVQWGESTRNLGRGTQREMIVLRHIPGSKNIMLYASNTYALAIDAYELTKEINSVSDAHLYVGATVTDGGDVGKYANGIMHFCRYYSEDLGESVCRQIANYPTEEYWIELCNFGGYYLTESSVTQTDVDFKFLTALWKTMQMNTTNTNAGGYTASIVGRWLPSRFFPALPQEWRSIIADCRVMHNNYVDGSAHNIVTSNLKVSILDVVEMNSNTTTAPWSTCGEPITYYVNDAARIHYQGITTRENYVTFTQGTDPALDPNNNVQEGDLWVDTSNSNAKKVFDGLVWRALTPVGFWLRSAPPTGSSGFAYVGSNGSVHTGNYTATGSNGVVPRFSIKKRR